MMNFMNPHYFAAILENIPHRFILIQECESRDNDDEDIPRFSVGAINATKDPRYANLRQLLAVGVTTTALEIPPGKYFFFFRVIVIIINATKFCIDNSVVDGSSVYLYHS